MKVKHYMSIAIVVAVLAVLPVVTTSNSFLNFLIYTLIIVLGAQGWNLLGGVAGQSSFGHAAFFGTGAYVMSLWQINLGMGPWTGFVIAVLTGALVGWIVGYLSFRAGLRGSYFALVTLAFAEVLRVLANSASFTGGAAGKLLPINLGLENFQFDDRVYFYWISLGLVTVGLVLCRWISLSRFGAHLIAVRENEDAAKALGVNVLKVKLQAISLSAGLTAAAGCLYVQYFLYIDPILVFGPKVSIEVLLSSMVGGLGTVFGPLVGTFALHGLGEAAKFFVAETPGIDLAIYGAVLIVAICFMPRGLLSLGPRLASLFARKQPDSFGTTHSSTSGGAPVSSGSTIARENTP